MLSRDLIGRSYTADYPFDVSRQKIREFADAIGDPNPRYRQGTAVAPPTFATIINIPAIMTIVNDPELGLDYGRLVHADQTFVHHRPITVGDKLVLTTRIEGAMSRAGNDMLTVRTEIVDTDGDAVSTTTATLVFRGEQA